MLINVSQIVADVSAYTGAPEYAVLIGAGAALCGVVSKLLSNLI